MIETCNNENVKLLIFSNPFNPTSVGITREAVRKIIRGVSALVVLSKPIWISETESMLGEFENYDNLLILKKKRAPAFSRRAAGKKALPWATKSLSAPSRL